ncbi:hypothetical protein B0H16DRAFT_1476709 [Mycena metata]|uniref:Uncharacterized protein n=1 Tax=Mycena metata TaxID=1033252 RepID=A0AAD7HBH8_9AGAR|nr:hypothetical protein B0H16DRAFT_1476709 [Mycena metata]
MSTANNTDLAMSIVLSPLTIIRPTSPRPSSAASLTIPSSFFGPWFLTKYAVLVMDIAFDQSEDITEGAFEQADSPCFAASDFETIVAYLPLVPDLANSFRRVGGRFQQHRPLYFVVEDHEEVFTSVLDAQRFHIETGDSTLGIYVFTSRELAMGMFPCNTLIDATAAQQIGGGA